MPGVPPMCRLNAVRPWGGGDRVAACVVLVMVSEGSLRWQSTTHGCVWVCGGVWPL